MPTGFLRQGKGQPSILAGPARPAALVCHQLIDQRRKSLRQAGLRRASRSRYATRDGRPDRLVQPPSRGRSSMVEPQPSKLVMPVRSRSPAPLRNPRSRAYPFGDRSRPVDASTRPRAINVPLPRWDEHAAPPIIRAALSPPLGLDMSVDRARDCLVSAPRLVLVDHRGTLAVVTHASHQVLDASPAGRCKRVPGVTQVVARRRCAAPGRASRSASGLGGPGRARRGRARLRSPSLPVRPIRREELSSSIKEAYDLAARLSGLRTTRRRFKLHSESIVVTGAGTPLVKRPAAATYTKSRTAGAAPDQDVIDATKRPIEIHLVRVFRNVRSQWFARMNGLPGVAVTLVPSMTCRPVQNLMLSEALSASRSQPRSHAPVTPRQAFPACRTATYWPS